MSRVSLVEARRTRPERSREAFHGSRRRIQLPAFAHSNPAGRQGPAQVRRVSRRDDSSQSEASTRRLGCDRLVHRDPVDTQEHQERGETATCEHLRVAARSRQAQLGSHSVRDVSTRHRFVPIRID